MLQVRNLGAERPEKGLQSPIISNQHTKEGGHQCLPTKEAAEIGGVSERSVERPKEKPPHGGIISSKEAAKLNSEPVPVLSQKEGVNQNTPISSNQHSKEGPQHCGSIST